MTDLTRRSFLASSAATVAAMGLAGTAFAAEADGSLSPDLANRTTLHGLEADPFDPDQDVAEDVVARICEAALTAPSAVGATSLEIIVVRDRETMQKIHELSPNANQLETCPVCLVLVEHAGAEDARPRFFLQDSGLAAMAALVQATHEGLCSCVMEARQQDKDTHEDNDYGFIGCGDFEQYVPELIIALGYPAVDAVTSASVTQDVEARVHFETAPAVEETTEEEPAEEQAPAAGGALADGTYEASGKGIGGDVPLTVTVEGGKIVSVEVGENGETVGIGSRAIEQLPAAIVEANGIDGVDGVSGASVTSKAIFSAMEDILAQAAA